jgi:ABC-type methionine transport system ATPase subunit
MLARLGFSVAAHVDAELIILDEVLAVGDAAFQRKCHVRIEEIRRSGGALLYVTHALWTVPLLCDEAILLKAGAVVARGKPDDVVKTYEAGEGSEQVVQSDGLAVISSMRSSVTVLDPGDPLDVDLSVNWSVPAPHGRVMVMIANGPGQAYAVVTAGLDQLPLSKPGEAAIRLSIQSVPLQPGGYEVYAAIQIDGRVPVVDDMRRLPLEVRGEAAEPSFGPILLPHSWAVPATQA